MVDYLQAVTTGLGNALSLSGLAIVLAGTLLAMLISFLPGIGTASLLTLLMLLTLSWSQTDVLLLFGALVGGATFMGSVTAILFNVPGSAPNAATLLDGHPLSRQGFTRTAIACAATASAVGSMFGVLVLLALLPILSGIVPALGPWEQLLLGIWGLSTIVALPASSRSKAVLMCLLGLLAAMLGSDPVTAQPRWLFGMESLIAGLQLVPVLLGMFTIAELISWSEQHFRTQASIPEQATDSTRAGIRAVLAHPGLTLKSSALGTLIGLIPGVGGTVAGFVAYSQAQRASGDSGSFGQGDIRGVIAPEAATDAKDGGSLVPAIALGLPGSEVGVFLVAVLILHGLVPGEPMLSAQLPLTMTLVFALLLSNLITSALGIALAPGLSRLGGIPLHRASLPVLLLSLLLIVQLNGSLFDLYTAIVFGLLGYGCKRLDWPRVPFVIAFVLGEFIERNLALSTRLIELGRIEPLQRPGGILIAAMILVSLLLLRKRGQQRPQTLLRSDVLSGALILVLCSLMVAMALINDYSLYALFLSLLGAAASLWVIRLGLLQWVGAAAAVNASQACIVLPGIFVSLAVFPVAVELLGFAPGLGLLVFVCLLQGKTGQSRHLLRAMLWSLLVTTVCHYLLTTVWRLQLDDGWILRLIG